MQGLDAAARLAREQSLLLQQSLKQQSLQQSQQPTSAKGRMGFETPPTPAPMPEKMRPKSDDSRPCPGAGQLRLGPLNCLWQRREPPLAVDLLDREQVPLMSGRAHRRKSTGCCCLVVQLRL